MHEVAKYGKMSVDSHRFTYSIKMPRTLQGRCKGGGGGGGGKKGGNSPPPVLPELRQAILMCVSCDQQNNIDQ